MKNFFLLLFGLLALTTMVMAQTGPKFQFKETEHKFGRVPEKGGPVKYTFEFTNVGDQPLIINNCKASCGCTTPSFSKEPVMPGQKGYINVQFNPAGRPGRFSKSISIFYNGTPNMELISIEGEVYTGEVRPTPKEYVQFFPYNKKTILLSDTAFARFIKDAKFLFDKTGKVSFNIESSASRVPTDKYKTNQELTMRRAEEAKEKLKKALDKAGVNLDLVFFSPPLTLVQGPEYANDWKDNIKVYEQYQYIKITAY